MSGSSPMENEALRLLGKYALIEKLQDGCLGPIYRGFDQELGRPVVLRILGGGIKWDADIEKRFFTEYRSVADLEHPNIASILEIGKEGRNSFIVTESLGCNTLETVIARSPMSAESKLSVMIQALEGLSYAHGKGVLHCDLSPAKIHLPPDGGVKIRDFAITHILKKRLSRPIVRWGSKIYLSPEQIQQKECDERSDIFSAGVIFYELLTGVHPFYDSNGNKALDNILTESPLPTFERFPDVPPGMWAILKTCLERDPADRYHNAVELLDACKDLQKSMAEDARLMMAELYAAMTSLRKAAAHRDASESMVKLLYDIEALSRGGGADYVSLDRLMTELMEQYPAIQAASEGSNSTDPPAFIDESAAETPSEAESSVLEGAVSLGEGGEGLRPADNPPPLDDERESGANSGADEMEHHPPASLSNENIEPFPDSVAPDPGAGIETRSRKAFWAPYRPKIPRPSYRCAAVLLSILLIAAAGYIFLETEAPASLQSMWNFLMTSPPAEANASMLDSGSGTSGVKSGASAANAAGGANSEEVRPQPREIEQRKVAEKENEWDRRLETNPPHRQQRTQIN